MKLTLIADRLYQYTEDPETNPARLQLPRGLYLTLQRLEADSYRLSLTRLYVAPSQQEIDICKRDFGIAPVTKQDGPRQVHGTEKAYQVVRIEYSRGPTQAALLNLF